ncbi:MAG: eL32 family ribosomal protein [archaeon]
MVKFTRRISNRYSKLGKRRKKKQIWRRPTGRDNKMREKRKGYPSVVSVGYKKNTKMKGKIKDKIPIIINNTKDLEKIKENQIVIIGRIGKKKKIKIAEKAKEMKLSIYNLNTKLFLNKNKIKKKEKKSKEIKKLDKKLEKNTGEIKK